MGKEFKIGLLALVVIAGMIIGYQYVKGKNVFSNTKEFTTVFSNIGQLEVAAPVLLNGFKVGTITDIELNPEDVKSILVSYQVDGNIGFPKNTVASLESAGLMGGQQITLIFDRLCDEDDCAVNGSQLRGKTTGMIESMMGVDNLDQYTSSIKDAIAGAFDTLSIKLSDKNSSSPINKVIWDMEATMSQMASLTKNMNSLLASSSKDLRQTMSNLNIISGSLVENSTQIKSLLGNVDSITSQLKEADLGNTISKSNTAIDESTKLISSLQETIEKSDATFSQMNEILNKVNDSDGSLSKFLNDKELYKNMESTSENLSLLLQDMRLNPGRYVRFSVFGKKDKKYNYPEDDPAYKKE